RRALQRDGGRAPGLPALASRWRAVGAAAGGADLGRPADLVGASGPQPLPECTDAAPGPWPGRRVRAVRGGEPGLLLDLLQPAAVAGEGAPGGSRPGRP